MFNKNETEKDIELIYNVIEDEKIDNVSVGMMKNNDIKSLLPMDIILHDSIIEFKYKTETKKTMNKYLCEELTKEELLNIFGNICEAMIDIEEYMLSDSQIVLDNEYIFTDNGNIKMILLPISNRKFSISISDFFKNLLLDMMVKNDKAAYFAPDISRQLSDKENFSYNKFLKLISELKLKKYKEKTNSPKKTEIKHELNERKINNIDEDIKPVSSFADYSGNRVETSANTFKQSNNQHMSNVEPMAKEMKEEKKKGLFCFGKIEKKQEIKDSNFIGGNSFLIPGRDEPVEVGSVNPQNLKEKKKFSLFGKKKDSVQIDNINNLSSKQKNSFAETTILQKYNDFAETTLLGLSEDILKAFLIWKRTGEKILIDKSNFRIGREKSYVDFCINDNTSVGRNHAEIIRKDGAFFIRDLKSLNFTMVNDEKISPSLEVELWDKDIISLSNEEFEFHIG